MKYTDKTDDEWDDIVDRWHSDDSIECSLTEYMQLDDEQYLRFLNGVRDDNLSLDEVKNINLNTVKEVVIELVIKPQLEFVTNLFK